MRKYYNQLFDNYASYSNFKYSGLFISTVDAAAGPENDDVNRTISSNVIENINLYQTQASMIGSHGGNNKKEENGNTTIVNVDLTRFTSEHGKIDEVTLTGVIKQILQDLNRK